MKLSDNTNFTRAMFRRFLSLGFFVGGLLVGQCTLASQNGRDGFSGNPATNGGAICTVCHALGAAPPTVGLTGPPVVDAGTAADFTVTLSGGPAVTGGVNISVVDENGKPVGQLESLNSDLQLLRDELSHVVPKAFAAGTVSFSFRYAAPNYDVATNIYVAGNATNGQLDLIGDGVAADSWSLDVVNGFEPPPPPEPPAGSATLSAEAFTTGLTRPVVVTHAGDERLFVVEKPGRIRIVDTDGSLRSTPFLDIESRVDEGANEMGLLGLAFHPNYGTNGYFYLYYTRDPGPGLDRSRVSRFTVSADPDLADPNSEQVLLEFAQPYSNHNGGDLHFGPDGYLYIASGDGGSGGDPQDNAQDPGNLLGKILRIDVDTPSGPGNAADCDISGAGNYAIPASNAYNDGTGGAGCDEIYALGLRNPWRFSFDQVSGELWIGDVGQNAEEEIDRIPAGSAGGLNLGWRCYEGERSYNLSGCSDPDAYFSPAHVFPHTPGDCSVTGGVVYRGDMYPALNGEYFFSDFCNTSVRAISPTHEVREVLPANVVATPSTFGTDLSGEMYLASFSGGVLYRLQVDEVPDLIGMHRNNRFYLDANGNGSWDAGADAWFAFGVSGDTPITGEWNGDGADEVGVHRSNRFYLDSNGNDAWDSGVDTAYSFGLPGDTPIIGDWNGDGFDEIGVHRGYRFYLDANGNGVWDSGVDAASSFGLPGDTPIIGDWNGDGIDEIGVHRGYRFYLDANGNGAWDSGVDADHSFGLLGDTPIIGDWNGDGSDEIGVHRGHRAYLDVNGNGAWDSGVDAANLFGLPGDTPLAGKW